ncbi:MAG: leucyl/phenylalanyl-tRNA--protein transferase [Devosia sp.]
MSRKTDPFAVDLTPDLILRAYRAGIFPMAEDADSTELFWVSPEMRGVIPLDSFHIGRTLQKTLRSNPYVVKVDTDFDGVIEGCATAGTERDSTWINADIRRLYGELFRRGHVHTVEVWDGPALVGGLYGVSIGAAFFGESMFHRKTDCSKIAMAHLGKRLVAGNYRLLDTQFVTDHLRTFGGIEIPREDYEVQLAEALQHSADWSALDR